MPIQISLLCLAVVPTHTISCRILRHGKRATVVRLSDISAFTFTFPFPQCRVVAKMCVPTFPECQTFSVKNVLYRINLKMSPVICVACVHMS